MSEARHARSSSRRLWVSTTMEKTWDEEAAGFETAFQFCFMPRFGEVISNDQNLPENASNIQNQGRTVKKGGPIAPRLDIVLRPGLPSP